MTDATRTTPVEQWADLYERTAPGEIDWSAPGLPVHPDIDQHGVIVVNHSITVVSRLGDTLPTPSYTFSAGGACQSVWWIAAPVVNTAETSKPWNTWAHVANALTFNLKGNPPAEVGLVNMNLYPDNLPAWQQTHYLADLRLHMRKHGMYTQAATLPRNFHSLGGQTKTPAQTEARRANMAKAREAASAARLARLGEPRVSE